MKVFNNEKGQIRSGWKIFITFVGFQAIVGVVGTIAIIAYMAAKIAASGDMSILTNPEELMKLINVSDMNNPISIFLFIFQNVALIFVVWALWKLFDKKKMKDLGLISIKRGWKDLIKGLLFGAISMALVLAVLVVTNSAYLVQPLSSPKFSMSALSGLAIFIFVGFGEEIFSRGYCLTVLKQTENRWVPVVVSSIIFSVMHGMNPNVTVIALLNIFLVGLLFAYMTIRSGNLWMAIGYHITWNYFQGNVFGFEVSGNVVEGIYSTRLTAENIINGGKFGPEGGLMVTAIILFGLLYIKYFCNRTEK